MRVTAAVAMVAGRGVAGARVAMLLAIVTAGCGPAAAPAGSGVPASSTSTASRAPATSGPVDTASPSVGGPGLDQPPDALLAAEGGDPVLGELGSYVWLETGSDAPWLPGSPIAVGAGEPLTVRFEPDGEIATWRARYVPADQGDPQGALSLGEGTGPPAFPAPPAGSSTVEVAVDFGQDVGSASYFWRLDVQ